MEMHLAELCAKLNHFFHRTAFLPERMTEDKLRLLRPGYLGDIFLKMNEISL